MATVKELRELSPKELRDARGRAGADALRAARTRRTTGVLDSTADLAQDQREHRALPDAWPREKELAAAARRGARPKE